ncbi:efflux RND transporter permease subunit [Hahella ganghwensis]|uniref:efflux RND transporter permease subunit n=1 Tax=Hahella ganghwensis TaxID=286420 RepID=UPI00037F0E75|nr:MMPL family transporter [Hahella ganghwensis]
MTERIFGRLLSHPKTVLTFMLLLFVICSIGNKNLFFRGDYGIFFDDTNKELQAFNEIEGTFNKTDSLAIIVAPDSGDIYNERFLELIRLLTEDAWNIPYSSRVDSIANYQHTEAREDDLLVEDLIYEGYPLETEYIDKIRSVAESAPRLKGSLVSASGDSAIINITFQLPGGDKTARVAEIMSYSDTMIASYEKNYPEVSFYQAGIVAMNSSFTKAAQKDIMTLVPLMLAVITLLLIVMLRSTTCVMLTMAIIVATVVATMGVYGWAGMYLSIATVNVPTMVMTLAVADCVHLITSVHDARRQGMNKREAIAHSLRLNFMAILVTSVTTAIGFLIMNASDSPVLRHMGSLSALGVMLACVFSIFLLPVLLLLVPFKVRGDQNSAPSGFFQWLPGIVLRYNRSIFVFSVLIVVIAGFMMKQNHVNDEPVKYFDTSHDFRLAADYMEQHVSGMTNISIAIRTGQTQGVVDPEFIATLDEFTRWVRDQPQTDHVASLADTYKRLNKNLHGDREEYYRLPEDREAAAQYLLLYELSLPYGLDINNEVDIDKSAVKVQLTTKNLGSSELVALEEEIYDWFRRHAPDYRIVASSPSLMFAHIGETNMYSMLKSLPIMLVLISALLVVALKSLRLGVISLLPTIVPVILGFGAWALISGEINLGLSVVVSLTLGIVVDDAVHFLSKYQYSRKQGSTAEEAIFYAFGTVGRALWITTVVLVAGFSVLALSSFRVNSDMGLLSALVIFIALIVDFLLLPAVLIVADRQTSEEDFPLVGGAAIAEASSSAKGSLSAKGSMLAEGSPIAKGSPLADSAHLYQSREYLEEKT